MERTRIESGTKWESAVGYSRAVRAGEQVFVSGTTATEDGAVVGVGDPYAQTKRAIGNIEDALAEAGASIPEVVRTRLFVTDIDDWEEIGQAHSEAFGEVRPATSMVEVARLIDLDMVVEIEAVAVVSSWSE